MKKTESSEILLANIVSNNDDLGVALINLPDYSIDFENSLFNGWFPGSHDFLSRIPSVKHEKLIRSLERKGFFSKEVEIKENKRSKVLKINMKVQADNQLFVWAHNYTKEKENEYLLDSYIKIAEKHKQELEASLELIKKQKNALEVSNAALEKEKNSVELRMLQAVLNPHFLSNSLSSIQGFIVDKNIEEAVNYLAHYGELMRMSFEQSYFDYVPVEDVLGLIKNYVSIEQMRMDQPWSFELIVDENLNVSNSKIPPMLIQPFIENAIWHGINRKKRNGKITLELILVDEMTLKCIVEDNGLGRNHENILKKGNSRERSFSLHSLDVTSKRLDILWQEHKRKHKIEYTDLKNAKSEPIGTRVELNIPLNF